MLPFLAQGHLIRFLALANQMARRFAFTITIATTPLNVRHLQATTATQPCPRIHFAALPFNSADHGLPPETENTDSLPHHLIVDLCHASTSLEPPFRALIRDIGASPRGEWRAASVERM
ncbi:hypothetical protein SASPL_113226 [Salvia splendens]|uniref:Glycosyltransferase N-terminal domain-containing protein n=1 Tax=Salvia splendens TaxID=180675 RepID=A0A8X8Y1J1_SALSN|nr:hypothetical protein SASPL_113226 [Salvia splendens]